MLAKPLRKSCERLLLLQPNRLPQNWGCQQSVVRVLQVLVAWGHTPWNRPPISSRCRNSQHSPSAAAGGSDGREGGQRLQTLFLTGPWGGSHPKHFPGEGGRLQLKRGWQEGGTANEADSN